jgi:mono/diheme cytochrome c family protein
MKFFVGILMFLSTLSSEDFITKMEYAKMLYSNPRGIGCNQCHGEKGEGLVIARYKDKGKKKELKAPAITNLKKEVFFNALEASHSIMPKYFLTKNELEILYFYVTSEVNR